MLGGLDVASAQFNFQLHKFRAIAIFMVVFFHMLFQQELIQQSSVNAVAINFIKALIGCPTLLFVFVSGFLLQHLNYSKYLSSNSFWPWYLMFMKGKLLKIYLPMLIVSCLILCLSQLLLLLPNGNSFFWYIDFSWMSRDPATFIMQLLLGHVQPSYWYLPFIIFVMAIVPLVFVRNQFLLIPLFILTFISAYFVHRNAFFYYLSGVEGFLHMFLYHIPFFYFGMIFCKYEKYFQCLIESRFLIILLVYISLIFLFIWDMNLPFMSGDFILLLLGFCQVFIIYHSIGNSKTCSFLLDALAKNSFLIYFLHLFLGVNLIRCIAKILHLNGQSCWIALIIGFIVTSFVSVLLIILGNQLRKFLGIRARYLFGA